MTARASWLIEHLRAANRRLPPEARAEKFHAMAADPFAFLRGANPVFWHDLGRAKVLAEFGGTAATRTWIQGDMHVANLGSFADDRGRVVYDLNDFDESVLGDYQLDLWRMAISLVLVLRGNGGFSGADEAAAIAALGSAYLSGVATRAANAGDGDRPFTAENTYGQLDDFLRRVAATRSPAALHRQFITVGGRGSLHLRRGRDLVPVLPEEAAELRDHWPAYLTTLAGGTGLDAGHFAILDIARRLHAGIGSLGLRRYFVLIAGSPGNPVLAGPLILDVKEQPAPSAYGRISPAAQAATSARCAGHHGQRTIAAARALGHATDDHLGWMTFARRHWSVRLRSPWKDALDTGLLTTPRRCRKMAEQWGAILANAHCRGDPRQRSAFDAAVGGRTEGRHGPFLQVLAQVVVPYADRAVADHRIFTAALTAGRLA